MRPSVASVKLWSVPDDDREEQAAGRWRELFRRADRLEFAAPAVEKRRRGRVFERVIHGMLAEEGLAPRTNFRPAGEEIDGSFFHRGRVMLLEAKWTQDPQPASSIYEFRGKVEGKLVGTIGVFISMSGYSADAVNALVAGKVINTILFTGDDMRAVVAGQVSFADALDRKLRAAAEDGTPLSPLRDPVSKRLADVAGGEDDPRPIKVIIVEGPLDALLVHALADELGPSPYQLEVLPAGGIFNLAAAANAASAARNDEPAVIIADGDGHPEAVRQRIKSDLDNLGSGAVRHLIIVLDPSLVEALGVPEGTEERKRQVLEPDSLLMRAKIRSADIYKVGGDRREIRKLLTELGLQGTRSSPHSHDDKRP